MEMNLQNKVSFSKSGVACLTECGGGNTKTGSVICIGDQYGNPKPAIYVPQKREYNGNHAAIPVVPGDVVVKVDRHHGDQLDVETYRIVGWDASGTIRYQQVSNQNNGVCADIYNAAIAKVNCFHCREPHYITNAERFNKPIYGKVRYFVGVNLAAETAMVCAYDTRFFWSNANPNGWTYQQMCAAEGPHTNEVFDSDSADDCFALLADEYPTFSVWDRTGHIYGRNN